MAERFGAVTVHTVHDQLWKPRLAHLILARNLQIAASTLLPGDTTANLFHQRNAGLILSGGEVLSAAPHDIDSRVINGQRTSRYSAAWQRVKSLDSLVDLAIHSRRENEYNELTVRLEGIFGLFCFAGSVDPNNSYQTPPSDVNQFATTADIPVYAIAKGRVYQSNFDSAIQQYTTRGDPISPVEISKSPWDLPASAINYLSQILQNDFQFPEVYSDYTKWIELGQARYKNALLTGARAKQRIEGFTQRPVSSLEDALLMFAFGDAAAQAGQEDIEKAAYAQASRFLPPELYSRFAAHLNPNGKFTVSRGELDEFIRSGSIDFLPGYKFSQSEQR